MMDTNNANNHQPDIILIGAGIMSATLGMLLKELEPTLSIAIFERLDAVAAESSDAWNNAGTGHSAFCELNYTPQQEDGSVDISKATKIASSFEVSKQFWAYLVEHNYISTAQSYISDIPHLSFVWGEDNVDFLKKRYEALITNPLFEGMQYTEDISLLKQWMPLIMEGRTINEKLAATRMDIGTDVNFGALTKAMITHLQAQDNVNLYLGTEIRNIERLSTGQWEISVKYLNSDDKSKFQTKFVFIGAGGGTLSLLEKSDIPEAAGYGGFPISGQWLKCTNESLIAKHDAKVYGKAAVGAPPMSVPHLDTRMIDGKKALLFGPYAGFSTRFLKHGSLMDLPKSIKLDNIIPMLSVGLKNIPLTKYLIQQVRQSPEDRLEALKEYVPTAQIDDWELAIAGQRVQVIKKDEEEGGVLEFGTEMVSAADGSLAALLGASPGASTAVSIMLDILQKCFPAKIHSAEWQYKLKEMIPTYGTSLAKNAELCKMTRKRTSKVLGL
ncbi:MAG: malate:quinone oxidoreductase [Ferruginibacter sp.]